MPVTLKEVGLIPAQGKREVSFLMRYDGVQNIHATIDDNDALDEMHEDNNHAYALLFHDMANSGYTLQTLRLDPALEATPVAATDGSGLTVGYNVQATVLGDTFTRANVLVQLCCAAICQALEGLAYAHAQGVFHGDVQPASVLVSNMGGYVVARIADLGLARCLIDAVDGRGQARGRLEGQSLEVDGEVRIEHPGANPGDFLDVRIVGATAHDLTAVALP